MRYPVTKITAEVRNPYNGRPETIVLEGEGILNLNDSLIKNESGQGYHADGRNADLGMSLTSEKVTPSE